MDILKRITEMRIEKGWTEYELAERSELTQSTISSWYRKKSYSLNTFDRAYLQRVWNIPFAIFS